MITRKQKDVLEDAIIKYGSVKQMLKCMEECAELTQSLAKFVGEYDPMVALEKEELEFITEEIADVLIMAQQMAMIFGEEQVKADINWKVDRLENRLEE